MIGRTQFNLFSKAIPIVLRQLKQEYGIDRADPDYTDEDYKYHCTLKLPENAYDGVYIGISLRDGNDAHVTFTVEVTADNDEGDVDVLAEWAINKPLRQMTPYTPERLAGDIVDTVEGAIDDASDVLPQYSI